MALIKETGAIITGANTYVTVEEADAFLAYHATRVAWAAMTTGDKEAALVQAARAMDAICAWKGQKMDIDQPRAWPRAGVMVSTVAEAWNPLYSRSGAGYPSDQVPQAVKDAQCELAALMAQGDRTADQDSAGIKSMKVGKGALEIEFDPSTAPRMIGRLPPALLSDYITGTGARGSVAVYRA